MAKHVKKLYRSRSDRILAGVAGGLGEYFEMDSVIFRILFILFLFIGGFSLLLYIILILIIPSEMEVATKKGKKRAKKEKEIKESWKFSGRHFVGLMVVLIGLVILLARMFPITWGWFRWDVFWAMIIVLIGFFILLKD